MSRAALLIVPVLVCAVGYSMVQGPETGGTVTAKSGGYTYAEPKDWAHRTPCGDGRVNSPGVLDDGCTKPDLNAEAGVYLLSQAVAAHRTVTELAQQLAGTVKGYQPCSGRGGEDACLRSTTDADHRGQLRVRLFKTFAVVVVCLRIDRMEVARGCDLVFNGIKPAT
jgi:hypothetical protein